MKTITLEKLRIFCQDAEAFEQFRGEHAGQTIQLYINKGKDKNSFDRNALIIKLINKGLSQKDIAELFNMTQQSVSKIISKKK